MKSLDLKIIKKNGWWIAAGLVLAAISVYFIYFHSRKKVAKVALPATGAGANQEVERVGFANCTDDFPLKKGRCGKRVEQLQMHLIRQYGAQFSVWGVDGKFGDETEALVLKFLKKDSVSEEYFNKTGMASLITNIYK